MTVVVVLLLVLIVVLAVFLGAVAAIASQAQKNLAELQQRYDHLAGETWGPPGPGDFPDEPF